MWKNNNLSIVIFALFLLCLVGHSYAGWKVYNDEQRQHGQSEATYGQFLGTSEFGETVFENWESEFLQMAVFVLLTTFLYQTGSSESKKHVARDEVDLDPRALRGEPDAPSARCVAADGN
jgi:hypothetical protein